MNNKYDNLFKQDFSSKQVDMLFLRLSDTLTDKEELIKLEEAYDRAQKKALKREFEEADRIYKEKSAFLCIN